MQKLPGEELTFESMKRILTESGETRREAEEERRLQLSQLFRTAPFQDLVVKTQPKVNKRRNLMNRRAPGFATSQNLIIFLRFSTTCYRTSCQKYSTRLQSSPEIQFNQEFHRLMLNRVKLRRTKSISQNYLFTKYLSLSFFEGIVIVNTN